MYLDIVIVIVSVLVIVSVSVTVMVTVTVTVSVPVSVPVYVAQAPRNSSLEMITLIRRTWLKHNIYNIQRYGDRRSVTHVSVVSTTTLTNMVSSRT